MSQSGRQARGFDQHGQHLVEARGLRRIFGQFPRCGTLHEPVGRGDQLPRGLKRAVHLAAFHRDVETPRRLGAERFQRHGVFGLVGRRGGQRSPAVAASHTDRAVDQVPEVVGQIGMVTGAQAFLVEIGVLTGGNVAHQVVTKRFRPVAVGQRVGIDHIARALAHFGPAEIPPTVNEKLRHRLDAGRFEHDGPVNPVRRHEDVFADDVRIAGPEAGEIRQR